MRAAFAARGPKRTWYSRSGQSQLAVASKRSPPERRSIEFCECGSCRIVCSEDTNIDWEYPRGGHGIVFKFG